MEQVLEFTNNHLMLTAGLVASLFFLLFTEFRLKSRQGIDLAVPDAVRLINDDAVVLDIRSKEDFDRGHIAGARNLTPDQVDGNEDRLSAMKGKKILIACDNGFRCSRVVGDLRKKGYEDIFALKGGIAAWQQDSMPLVSAKKSGKKNKKKKS
ncbi:MAG: rhodanese-like domain-containing protein [Pseudomonadota bacterium]